jgi:hypothetical protein
MRALCEGHAPRTTAPVNAEISEERTRLTDNYRESFMMENLISGIIVLCIGGVTALAIKEPAYYKNLFPHLFGCLTALILLVLMWDMATSLFLTYFDDIIKPADMVLALARLKTIQIPIMNSVAIYTCFTCYTALLLTIPKLNRDKSN